MVKIQHVVTPDLIFEEQGFCNFSHFFLFLIFTPLIVRFFFEFLHSVCLHSNIRFWDFVFLHFLRTRCFRDWRPLPPEIPPSAGDLPARPKFCSFVFPNRYNFHSFFLFSGSLRWILAVLWEPGWGPEGWGAQNFEFWWCLKRRDAQMCAFGVLGVSCQALAVFAKCQEQFYHWPKKSTTNCNKFWVILAEMCVRLLVRSCVCHRVGPFWVHFWSIMCPFWVRVVSVLCPFGVHLGSIWGPFCLLSECFIHFENSSFQSVFKQESVFRQESVFTQESITRQELMFRQESSLCKQDLV